MTARSQSLEERAVRQVEHGAAVELVRARSGLWWWVYRSDEDHTEIRSNRGFVSSEEAERSARAAYPGVPVGADLLAGGRRRRTRLAAWMLIVLVLGLAGVAIAVAVSLARRRSGRR